MFRKFQNRVAVLGGSLALLAIGAMPAAASVPACPSGTPATFGASTVWLGQDVASFTPATPIWHGTVFLHAYCGTVDDSDNWLSNVVVTGIYANSNGAITNLEASADGVNWTTLDLNIPGKLLTTPPGLITDSQGNAQFTLYEQSPDTSFLAAPDGGTQVIGMQFDAARGNITGGASPTTFRMFGGADVVASTPELDSLALFGTGAAGMAGYALLRLRARRRRD